jgi:dephospho-CoA kinase
VESRAGRAWSARSFRERGVPVVDDDAAARDAVAVGTPGLAAVVAEFGAEVLGPDGALDRPKLGRIIFADDRLRRRLMGVTFPSSAGSCSSGSRAAEVSGAPMVVYESALLIENGRRRAGDRSSSCRPPPRSSSRGSARAMA